MALRAAAGGLAYFALVFLAGTLMGMVRTQLVAPFFGAVPATLIELPIMLAASWLICGWVLARLAVGADAASRLVMGGLAFALLMAAELALTLFVAGGTIAGHFAAYREPAALLGLAGQLIFAAMPLLRARQRS